MGRARPACPRWGRGPAPRWVHSCRTPCARVPIPAPVARWASPDVPLPRAAGWPVRCGGTKRWWAPQRPVLLPAGGGRPSSRPRSRRLVFLVCLAVPGTLLLWWPEGRGRPHHGAGCWRWRPRCLRRCRGARWSPRAASLRSCASAVGSAGRRGPAHGRATARAAELGSRSVLGWQCARGAPVMPVAGARLLAPGRPRG